MFGDIDGEFDVIVSNPPYIPSDDIEKLDKEVKDYDPRISLDGGKDGLDFYRIIADNANRYLSSSGLVLLEVGIGQAQDVAAMFVGYDSQILKDLQGIDRIVVLRKRAAEE